MWLTIALAVILGNCLSCLARIKGGSGNRQGKGELADYSIPPVRIRRMFGRARRRSPACADRFPL
jgi:hypothetical protein